MLLQAKNSGHVTFICELMPGAEEVYLVGNFNHWRASEQRMLRAQDGSFRSRLELAPGQYQYMFIVDGTWHNDPDAPHEQKGPCGEFNSAFTVQECLPLSR